MFANVEIDTLRDNDRGEYRRLLRDLHPADADPAPDRFDSVWSEIVRAGHIHVVVARSGERLLASCTLVIVPNLTRGARPYAIVENVVTAAPFRRQGLGTAVLRDALRRAWDAGCYKVMLMTGSTRPGTLEFYRKAGFQSGRKTAFVAHPPT